MRGDRVSTTSVPPYLVNAWRQAVPGVTLDEIDAILPIVKAGQGRLRGMVDAYRAGHAAGARKATPLDPPLAGFRPCPECLSVRVPSVVFGLTGNPRSLGMFARCQDCDTVYAASDDEQPTGRRGPAGHSADADTSGVEATPRTLPAPR